MLGRFTDALSESAWSYAIEGGFVALDGFFPVVPGETVVITAAVIAAGGDLVVWLVLLAAFTGAVAGDNVSYGLGVGVCRPLARRLLRGERSRRLLGWARVQLRDRGLLVIVVARFIPGGRTAATLAAGTLRMPWRRFIRADLAGAGLWAAYATALGWFGGAAFKDSFWKPLLISFGVAAVVAAIGELIRRRQAGDDAGNGGGRSYPREAEDVLSGSVDARDQG